MKRTVFSLALGIVMLTMGCAEVQELSIQARNHGAAYGAWKSARWDYWRQGVPHRVREHIGRGFQQGYFDVADGGTGRLPMFPPSVYWGVKYQSPEGNELVAAWFRGYQDGALAAERDGVAGFNQIPSSYQQMPGPNGAPPGMDPNNPYGEPLPSPPSTFELTPIPPTLEPGTIVPPPFQEDVPLRTLDIPSAPPPGAPTLTNPANPSNPSMVPGATGAPVIPLPGSPSTSPLAPVSPPASTPSGTGPSTTTPRLKVPGQNEPLPLKSGAPSPTAPATTPPPSTPPLKPATPTPSATGKQAEAMPSDSFSPLARETLFGSAAQ